MKKQTIRTIAAVFACAIVSTGMVSTAFAEELTTTTTVAGTTTTHNLLTTTTGETTTTGDSTTTTFDGTTTTDVTTTTVYTDAPLERVTPGQVAVDEEAHAMFNEFLKLVAFSDGKFTLGTTNGDPLTATDNDAKMLYGFPDSTTSYTTIRVDGQTYRYQADAENQPVFDAENKKVTSGMTIGNLFVTQTLSFVNNVSTGEENVIEIRYDVKNNDTVAHNVGGRIMLDTMLGRNDHAPFRVPGTGDVTTEKEYVGDAIPDYWQAFDNLTNPSVIAQGSFKRADFNHPDRVQFTNWGGVSSTPWGYQVTEGSANGDSAVSAIWDEKNLDSGATFVYRTYYGLSELTQNLLPPLALSAYTDATVNLNTTEDAVKRSVTSYIQNIGEGDATNAYVRIQLPEGWEIVDTRTDEEKAEDPDLDLSRVELGTLAAGSPVVQKDWTISIPADAELGTYPVVIYCGCDEIEEKSVTRYVTLINTNRETPPPVNPVPNQTTTTAPTSNTTVTTTKAPTSSNTTSTAPKTGDAGVTGVAAALATSAAVAFFVKRKKNH
ncbi:MAG TPA: hypothetical protein DCG49_07910 [Ruminococcus sp.]|nr:hypothetical protein [Ruminococcus sp.]